MGNGLEFCASLPNEGADAVLLNVGIRPFLPPVSNSHLDPGLTEHTTKIMFRCKPPIFRQHGLQYFVPYSSKS